MASWPRPRPLPGFTSTQQHEVCFDAASPVTDLVSTAEAMRSHSAEAARLLKALGNEKRLMVLCLLAQGERSVGDLNARVDLSQSALSQHLAVLRNDGLVRARRETQTIYYSLRRVLPSASSPRCTTSTVQAIRPL